MASNRLIDPLGLAQYAVGFEDMFNRLLTIEDLAFTSYPPYNIRKSTETLYAIELAVAGFAEEDIDITLFNNILTVKGEIRNKETQQYLYKGLAERAFTRTFTLADNVEVKNAEIVKGILYIWLERTLPPESSPRKIEISGGKSKTLPESKESTAQFLTEKYGEK